MEVDIGKPGINDFAPPGPAASGRAERELIQSMQIE